MVITLFQDYIYQKRSGIDYEIKMKLGILP